MPAKKKSTSGRKTPRVPKKRTTKRTAAEPARIVPKSELRRIIYFLKDGHKPFRAAFTTELKTTLETPAGKTLEVQSSQLKTKGFVQVTDKSEKRLIWRAFNPPSKKRRKKITGKICSFSLYPEDVALLKRLKAENRDRTGRLSKSECVRYALRTCNWDEMPDNLF